MLHLLWPTACEWHCTFQVKGSLIHLFLWPIAGEWCCTFCERECHYIFSHDWQKVSDITHFVNSCLITSFHVSNRLWATLHISWMAVLSNILLWSTACEWCGTYCERQTSPITFLPMTKGSEWLSTFCERWSHNIRMINSEWVTLHIVWKTVSSHLFLWPTASEWQCTFCERQSCHIFCYDAQQVSGIAHFGKGFLFIHDEQQVSDTAHFMKGCLIISLPMVNSK